MPAIKKILFPVDFSKRCIGAARYVEAMAGRFEAEGSDRGSLAPQESFALTLARVLSSGTCFQEVTSRFRLQ
jgi:hypothetical protein